MRQSSRFTSWSPTHSSPFLWEQASPLPGWSLLRDQRSSFVYVLFWPLAFSDSFRIGFVRYPGWQLTKYSHIPSSFEHQPTYSQSPSPSHPMPTGSSQIGTSARIYKQAGRFGWTPCLSLHKRETSPNSVCTEETLNRGVVPIAQFCTSGSRCGPLQCPPRSLAFDHSWA